MITRRATRQHSDTSEASGGEHGVDDSRGLRRERDRILDRRRKSSTLCNTEGSSQHGQGRCGGSRRQAAITTSLPDTRGTKKSGWTDLAKCELWQEDLRETVSPDVDFYAGAPKLTTLRGLLTVAAIRGNPSAFGDCHSAFLQSPMPSESEPVCVGPVLEAQVDSSEVWLCKKAFRGLVISPLACSVNSTQNINDMNLHAAEIMLRRVHANLGHPSKGLMLRLLRDANAPPEMLAVARDFHCSRCVQVSRSKELGHTISIDACQWKRNRDGREAIIVNIVDEASRFHVALGHKEGDGLGNLEAMDYIEAVRMNWFLFARAPAVIRVDSEGAFKSHEFREWCAARGIDVQMAAGEAYWQIGIVETHIRLLKNQLSLMEDELPDASIDELVGHSVAAKVRRQTFDGYSPLQWWFGTQCAREVAEHGLGENRSSFERRLGCL